VKALNIKPEYSEAMFSLAVALSGLGNDESAIEVLTNHIAIKPYHVTSYLNRSIAYSKTAAFAKAAKDYSKVIKLNPNHANFLSEITLALLK
jgi:tetratricopeptide (TPR) repeat protein